MWLSQTAIAKELGVPRRTIGDWPNGSSKEAKSATIPQTAKSAYLNSRYLVVCQSVEKFWPFSGILARAVSQRTTTLKEFLIILVGIMLIVCDNTNTVVEYHCSLLYQFLGGSLYNNYKE
ncbi:hypothetical protein ES703_109552 [subsurface metagenome]